MLEMKFVIYYRAASLLSQACRHFTIDVKGFLAPLDSAKHCYSQLWQHSHARITWLIFHVHIPTVEYVLSSTHGLGTLECSCIGRWALDTYLDM